MAMDSLEDVMIDLLRDIYHAEKQLVGALPKMQKAAATPELKDAFENHLEQTRGQIRRLEEVFSALEMKPSAKLCHGMKGLVEEGKEVIAEKRGANPDAIDAALIAAAQKVEHYEITAYGTLATFAKQLGRDDIAELFEETLSEEEETDELLSKLAEESINSRAAAGEDEEGDEEEEAPATRRGAAKSGRKPSR